MDKYYAYTQAIEEDKIMDQAGKLAIEHRFTAEYHNKGPAPEGIDIRGRVPKLANKGFFVGRHNRLVSVLFLTTAGIVPQQSLQMRM